MRPCISASALTFSVHKSNPDALFTDGSEADVDTGSV